MHVEMVIMTVSWPAAKLVMAMALGYDILVHVFISL